MTRYTRAILATGIATAIVGLVAVPALATPSAVRIDAVYEMRTCSTTSFCQPGDPEVAESDVVSSRIQVDVSGSPGSLQPSMRWFELQALAPGGNAADDGDWVCISHKQTSANSSWLTWSITSYPGDQGEAPAGCSASSKHGDVTPNGTFKLRVLGSDGAGNARTSSSFNAYFSNRPSAPEWYGSPRVLGDGTTTPRVQIRWRAQSDEGIAEYHIVRQDPSGSEVEFAINAAKPGGQGCSSSISLAYTCYDDTLHGYNYGGEYTYEVYGYRATQASSSDPGVTSCEFSSGNCIESLDGSGGLDVMMTAPASPTPTQPPSSSSTPTPSVKPTKLHRPRVVATHSSGSGSSGSYCDFYCGEFDKSLPFGEHAGSLPGASGGGLFAGSQELAGGDVGIGYVPPFENRERPATMLAGGLLMLLVAGHLVRILKHSKPY